MKFVLGFVIFFLFFPAGINSLAGSESKAGFFLPENVSELTFKYKSIQNLIVLPVVINDSISVNLILDTGCRNLVLFGRKFQKLFQTEPDKRVQFSGLGNGKAVEGRLSLNNKVSIQTVIGERIPIVLVSQQNLFSTYSNIHGIIGYDIFIKFEVELNPLLQLITFRPAAAATLAPGYSKIPLRIKDSRPLIQSHVFFSGSDVQHCDLMVDTGSDLGLLMKTTDLKKIPRSTHKKVLGKGLNGDVVGIEALAEKLLLDTFEIASIPAGVTYSSWHNYASVGMGVLKDYSIVLNYCQAYVGFRKNT